MKSVGKQLQEARLAKNWTPELAARETKIKVDRVRDLEVDDYSNFSSPTYARGFVRTYARSLGLDEYKILRQLDNKLPEDDNASFANETGLPYVPEPSQAVHVSSANRIGLYVVFGLGCGVAMVIAFVLLEAYRAGEFPRYFAGSSDTSTNSASGSVASVVDAEAPAHALPVDPNDTTHSVRALPVDLGSLAAAPASNAAVAVPVAAAATPSPAGATPADSPAASDTSLKALPVDPASPAANPAPVQVASLSPPAASDPNPPLADIHTKTPPRALPVDPSEMAAADATPPTVPSAPAPAITASDTTPGTTANTDASPSPAETSAAPVQLDLTPATNAAPTATPVSTAPSAPPDVSTAAPTPASGSADSSAGKRLVLTASRDSFVRVTSLDTEGHDVLYASVLHEGQSHSFGGRKFSVNVGIPSAVDITLDGVNYGPHSDGDAPETFTLESHQP